MGDPGGVMSTSIISGRNYDERDYSFFDERVDERIVEIDSFLAERIMSTTERYNP